MVCALSSDDEQLAGLDDGAGQVVLRLEGFQRNAKPFGDFLQRVARANFVPPAAVRFDLLRSRGERGEFIGWHTVEELSDFRARTYRHLQMIGRIIGRGGIAPQFRVEELQVFV